MTEVFHRRYMFDKPIAIGPDQVLEYELQKDGTARGMVMSKVIESADVTISVEDMLTQLKRQGTINVTVVNGDWWCYFKVQSGDAAISIDGNRRAGWSLWDAVNDCYTKVQRILNQGRRSHD